MTDFGQLIVTRHESGGGKEVLIVAFTAEWKGPKTIIISEGLMDDHQDPPFHREGDDLTICQFKLRVIGRRPNGDYMAERVEP